jgi:ABC-2 type transport system permease protein
VPSISNIFWLGLKELRSFSHDIVLLGLVIYAFSVAVISQAQSNSQEVHNGSIAIVDEDHSELSRRIAGAFLPPYFNPARAIPERDIAPLMNNGTYTFVIDVPPHFERDVVGGRQPTIQINVDATAMIQAGIGAAYAQQIISNEVNAFLSRTEGTPPAPVNLAVRIAFNPNITTAWFISVMAISNNVTMLAIILAGAAIVREREHGTMDHLLVMPLTPFEIAMAKVWANGLVIVAAVGLSLYLVVRKMLGVPITGSVPLFMIGCSDLSVFCNVDWDFPWNRGAFDATVGIVVHAGVLADESALRQQHTGRKHAVVARHPYAGLTLDAFRVVCASDSLPRRRLWGDLAGIPRGRPYWRHFLRSRAPALPLGHGAGSVGQPTLRAC